MRDLKMLEVFVTAWTKQQPEGSPNRTRGEALLAKVCGEIEGQPPSLGPAVARVLLDVATQSPERAAHAVTQLAESFYKTGDVEAPALLRRTAETIRTVKSQGGGEMPGAGRGRGGGGLADEVASLIDQRCVDWYEPGSFDEPVIVPQRMRPQLDRLIHELKMVSTFLDLGIDAPTRVLFHGPSGVGKTLVARWIGAQLDAPVALVRLDGVESPIIGQTIKNMRHVFETVGRRPGAVVFLDEIDGIAIRRDEGTGSMAMSGQQVTSALLQQLDAMPKDQVVIAATNFLEKLDPALNRRIGKKVEFHYPDPEARGAMLDAWWKKLKVDANARDHLVGETDRRSGDFLRNLAHAAARLAITDEKAPGAMRVKLAHVKAALDDAVAPGEFRPAKDNPQLN
jgi:hypothetical protein